MNQVTSETNAKRKPHSILEIAGGILVLAVGVLVAIAAYHMVVSHVVRAQRSFETGDWLGAAAALVIPIMLVCGLVSWLRK